MGILDFLFKKNLANYELKYKEAERKYYNQQYEAAIIDLTALVNEYPHYQCYGLMGSCYYELNKFDKALANYNKSIEKEASYEKNSMAYRRIEAVQKKLSKQKEIVDITPKEGKSIIDIDGNSYKTIILEEQTWFGENLNVTKFRNGDDIPEAITTKEWDTAGKEGKPVWCYYNNDLENGKIYGILYNWYAVNDPRGLAPEGTHIPSIEEWNRLVELLGVHTGKYMKSSNGWIENGNGTNKSMLNVLPGGYRIHRYMNLIEAKCPLTGTEDFLSIGELCCFWSVSKHSYEDTVWDGLLIYDRDSISLQEGDKKNGNYIRCIVD